MFFMKLLAALGIACALGGSASAQTPVTIPEDYPAKEVDVEFTADGPTLLFSDSPEMVYKTGVLYRDTVQGKLRLFFHHVNAVEQDKKLAVLVKNEDQLRPAAYKITRSGVGNLSYNYMEAGKEAQQLYFADAQKTQQGKLGFGEQVELLSGKGVVVPQNMLLTGTVDFELTRPAQVTVLMGEKACNLEFYNEAAPIQPMDEHPLRGTFANSDWHYKVKKAVSVKGGPQKLKLAGAEEGYAQGVDATTGKPAENYGNYGVIYYVDFKVKGKKPVSFIVNPIGGEFAGYGVLVSKEGRHLVAIPENALCLGANIEEAVELGKLSKGEYTFIWSPPGASNLPIELIWR